MENGVDVDYSAVQFVKQQLGLQVCAIATLADLLDYLKPQAGTDNYQRVLAYRECYGV